jgi:2-oxo-4-hydroxy-4-carboxy-5-ureidoimidazoline decarboxylase
MSLDALNNASQSEFLALIGGPLEGETWLAERVAAHRPFADVDALYRAFEREVAAASEAERIALIASHPDLGNKLAVGRPLSADSVREQASAGLDRLTEGEYAEFHTLNTNYREAFGFPFVICAREHNKDSILAAFRSRRQNSRAQEIETAVREVLKILRLRLIDKYG